MKKVYFVILHYQNTEDTIKCIESIDSLWANNVEKHIVLIDNHSPNNSGVELEKKYNNRKDMDILLLDDNYGFTTANNKGYKLAKDAGADIVLVLNNDIIFEDSKFLDLLLKDYKSYDIIAPDIINIHNNHQNPLRSKPYSLKKAYKNLIFQEASFVIYHLPLINRIFLKWNKKREEQWFNNYFSLQKNITDNKHFVPFGACIIYTGEYLKNEDKAFVGTSFMYMEEEFLGLYVEHKNYKLFYNQNLMVRHLEGRSTKFSLDNELKRLIFRSKHQAKAIKLYIKYYKGLVR